VFICIAAFTVVVFNVMHRTDENKTEYTEYYEGGISRVVEQIPIFSAVEPQTLHFSHPAGLYQRPFHLQITLEHEVEGASIYFTIDGSNPVPGSSFLYTSPLFIVNRTPVSNVLSAIPGYRIGCFLVYFEDYFTPPEAPVFKGTVIRAQAFDQYTRPLSDIVTKSYFVCPDIFTRYAGLPIISLATDAANFFDDEIGIYVRGHNNTGGHSHGDPTPNWEQRGREWERPVHFEMFETDRERVIAMDMGVRIHGGATRRLAQKSLRLYARAYYDPMQPTISHDIFQGGAVDIFGEPIVEFDRLLLRNFGNEGNGTMIRDAGLQYLSRHLNVNYQASRPAVVFLNGEFWGAYYIMERIDAMYFASHYNVSRHDVAVLSRSTRYGFVLAEGGEDDLEDFRNLEEFFYNNSFSSDFMYRRARQYIDIDNFIDYYILQIYFGNIDWPGNNMRVWRYNGPPNPDVPGLDGRWRWILFDLCSTTGFSSFSFNYYEDTLKRILHLPEEREPMRGEVFAHPDSTLMFRRLMENESFRVKFVNRFVYIMDNYFQEELFLDMVDSFAEQLRPVVPEQIERFGRLYNMEAWEYNLGILRTFGINRQGYMLEFLELNIP